MLVPRASAQTPTLVRYANGENSRAAGYTSTPTDYYTHLSEPALAGNCTGVFVSWSNANSPTVTVTGDKNGSYGSAAQSVSGPGYSGAVWVFPNSAAGEHILDIHFTTETANIVPITFEQANCATTSPVDVSNGQQASGTTISAGNITPSSSGEMILQFAAFENSSVPATSSFTAGSQSNITWQPRIAECLDGIFMQSGIYNSTSQFNPSFTTGTSNSYISIAIALKTASAGSTPAGLYVLSQQHVSMHSTATGGPGYNNPSVTQFPCYGNLLVIMANGGAPITSVSEAGSALSYVNWGNATYPPSYIGTGESETEQVFYSANHTCNNANTFSISPNLSYTGPGYDYDFTLVAYDIVNAATAPLDSSASAAASGDITTLNSSVTGPTLTPSAAGELILDMESEWYGQVTSVSGGGILDSNYAEQNGYIISMPVDEQNGWEHYLDATTASHTVTYNLNFTGTNNWPAYWAAVAVAFRPSSANRPLLIWSSLEVPSTSLWEAKREMDHWAIGIESLSH
jgi:hypothetical protein